MNKIFKRLLSTLVAVIMMCPVISMAQETTAPVQKTDANIAELNALGIFDFDEALTDKVMTREEYAGALSKLINAENNIVVSALDSKLAYADVDEESKYAKSIYAMQALGIMQGTEPYIFAPQKAMTAEAAIKTLVIALGYRAMGEGGGGYPNGYIKAGMRIDLLDRASVSGPLTVGNCAKLFINAIEVSVADISGVGGKIQYNASGNTLLSIYHNIYKIEDRMTDNGISSLKGKSEVNKENVVVGEVIMKADANARSFLGSDVVCYYKDNGNYNSLVHIKESKRVNNNTLVIKAEDLETDSITRTSISYRDGNMVKTVAVDQFADCIYNGAAYTGFIGDTFKIEAGQITLVNTDSDKEYELVKVEEYEIVVLTYANLNMNILYDRYGNNIEFKEVEEIVVTDKNHLSFPIQNLTEGMVLSVYKSMNDEMIRIVKSEDKAVGMLEAIDATEETYTVAGIDYPYAESFMDLIDSGYLSVSEPSLGLSYTFYLDHLGNIVAMDEGTADDKFRPEQYAYFISMGTDTKSALDPEDVKIRVMLDDSSIVNMVLADKITIDGVKNLKPADILSHTPLYTDGDVSKGVLPQLIKIEINRKGEVLSVDTAINNPKDSKSAAEELHFNATEFSLDVKGTSSDEYVHSYHGYAGYKYGVPADTPIFMVPPQAMFDEDYLYVAKPVELWSRYNSFKLYDINEVGQASVGVVEYGGNYASEIDKLGIIYIVQEVKVAKDEDGEYKKSILCELINETRGQRNFFTEERPGIIDECIPAGVKPGDVVKIRFASNVREYVRGITLLYSPEAGGDNTGSEPGDDEDSETDSDIVGDESDSYTKIYTGYVAARTKEGFTIKSGGKYFAFNVWGSYPHVFIYNKTEKTMRRGSIADIPQPEPLNADGTFNVDESQKIMVARGRGEAQFVVLYEN